MKTKKNVISLTVLFCLLLLFGGCKKSNNSKDSLIENDIVRSKAYYVNWTVGTSNRYKGIQKVYLKGTQAFDSNYYGYDGDSSVRLTSGISGSNQTIGYLLQADDPDPTNTKNLFFNNPFADGSFPTISAWTGYMHPVSVTLKEEVEYDSDDTTTDSNTYEKWEITYDSAGYPTLFTKTPWSAASDAQSGSDITKYSFTAASSDPYIDYYLSSYTIEDASSGSATTAYAYTPVSASDVKANYTEICYSDNQSTMADNCSFTNDAVKITYASSLSGSVNTQTTNYFNTSDQEFYRFIETRTYADQDLGQYSSRNYRYYNVDTTSGDATWDATSDNNHDRVYTNGFETTRTYYSAEETTSRTMTYTRDAQGRETDFLETDASGDSDWHRAYTFDTSGRISSVRNYGFTGGTQNSTPSCSSTYLAQDYSWSIDATSDVTKTVIDYCDSSNVYQTNPVSKIEYTYNTNGSLTTQQNYSYASGTYTLTNKITYDYDDNGNKAKKQYYDVSADVATASGYYTYIYDSNYYLVTTKGYDASSDLSTDPTVTTSKCTSGSACYRTIIYTYK
jgi:hypothetical protein